MQPEPHPVSATASASCATALEALADACRDVQARGVPPELAGSHVAPFVLAFALRARDARMPSARVLRTLREALEPLALLPEEQDALMRRAIDTYYQVATSGILRGDQP